MVRILSRWAVLSIGVVFHVIFIMSIFDIYFMSPLVHGMRHFAPANPDPAKRLFLIVGDGLRADKFFEPQVYPQSNESVVLAPHLMDKVHTKQAMSGVSHTRMPTESRPGHVALIAGFYEDVSAVTKGWQTNPVDFDSCFNQSRHTWSYGSPDILPMFAYGADPGRVSAEWYDAAFEDFTKSSIDLDKYTFDKVDALFSESKHNKTLDEELRADKNILFLHLLGIDSAGHAKRPNSAEYYDNIKYVDMKVKELEQKVNDFYGDDDTVFIFTADHGMSDLGSHGDGHPDNTRTPIVAWGKGIRTPYLDEVVKADIEQADMAMLMSYLVGINYPANSVGKLPLRYINASAETKSRALVANALSIIEQYLVKERTVSKAQIRYTPYPRLSDNLSVERRTSQINQLLENGEWEQAAGEAQDLIMNGLRGLTYLQKYNWMLLRTLVTLGFLGWIAFALTSFLQQFVVPDIKVEFNKQLFGFAIVAVFLPLTCLFIKQDSPLNYYFYGWFPIFFWFVTFNFRDVWKYGMRRLVNGKDATKLEFTWKHLLGLLGGIALLETIVCGYFHRELFSLILVVVYIPWPWISNWRAALKHWPTTILWTLSCISLAYFGLLPVNKVEDLNMIIGSGVLMTVLSFCFSVYLSTQIWMSTVTMVTIGFQLSLIVLSAIVTNVSVKSLQAGEGLPIGSQLVSWMTLLFSGLVPFMHSLSPVRDYRFRLLNVFMLFCPPMVILSISYEGYFYVAFASLLVSWLHLESRLTSKSIDLGIFRMALTFLFLTHIAFFATGNIASISSFSLDSVYRLIPVFSPFAMGALLVLKLLIPFILLSVVLGIINIRVGLPKFALFSMVLAVSDVLSLNFFYLVVDEGSWLDIGTGISHFCICSLLCLFLSLIEYLSTALVSGVELEVDEIREREEIPKLKRE